jgi:epoxyqueuosine reductase QueG
MDGCDVCQDACAWNVRLSEGLLDDSPDTARDARGERRAHRLALR